MNTSKKRTFSKSIINKFHKLVEVPATIQAKVSLLEDMEEIFDDDIFLYKREEDQVLAMKYLLGTWEIMIHDVKGLRTRDQYVIYRVITKIIKRKEFFLESCHYDPETHSLSSLFLPLFKKFSHLLLTTFYYCQALLHEPVSAVPILFASKVIALCYYRLPAVHHLINSCLLQLYPSSTFESLKQNFYLIPQEEFGTPVQIGESFSEADADRFSERSTVTVDFSNDVILMASVLTPSPEPRDSEFSPIPDRISPSLEEYILEDDLPVDISSLEALQAKNYTKSVKHQLSRHTPHPAVQSQLRMNLPSLFYWMQVVEEEMSEVEPESWWIDRFKVCDPLFFDLIRCRAEHLHDYQAFANTCTLVAVFLLAFSSDTFPCYSLFLRCFLPSFQHAVLQKYNCGVQRRVDTSKASEYLAAGIKTSCTFLDDPDVVSMLFEIVMNECNVFNSSDITAFFIYLNTWCDELGKRSTDCRSQNEDVRLSVIEGVQHFLTLHPEGDEQQLCEYLIANDFCCDSSEVKNVMEVLKREDVLIWVNNSLVIQNCFDPFRMKETPLFSLPIYFPYFSLYSSLLLILEQDQLFILKRGLLFIYNHFELFVGNYRYYFFSQLFSRQFTRLFTHWDANVRLVFHHLLLYRSLLSLQKETPHLTSNQLLSFLDEERLEQSIQHQIGPSKQTRSTLSQFISLMKKWKKKKERVEGIRSEMNSIDDETICIDVVLASKIDSYVVMLITELNDPVKYKIPRHQHFNLLISIMEYMLLLVEYEQKEKKVNSRAKLKIPTFDTSFILQDPNQK